MNRIYLTKLSTSPYDAGIGAEPEESRNIFLNEFGLLPPSLQSFLTSDETSEAIADLSEHYDLGIAQTELVAWTIRDTVTGNTYIKELPQLIVRMTGLNLQKSTDIFNYIIKNIFAPYWEDIKKIQISKFGNEESSPQQTPVNPPSFHEQNMASLPKQQYPGEELPETGSNIIDLRNQK